MSKIGKNTSNTSRPTTIADDAESSMTNKPLASTILQELQNLKDNLNKFKNEDDNQDKGKNMNIIFIISSK